jgi:hypothetical protein
MPGVILYRECKVRLEAIKKENPELFGRRSLFLEVMRILECYTFKLTARRDIVNLFSDTAKQKKALDSTSLPSSPMGVSVLSAVMEESPSDMYS